MSFKNSLRWYQLSQKNGKRKISPKIVKFYKISREEISVFKVIVLRKLINFQSHVFKCEKRQVKWLHARKKVSDKNTKELRGSL